MASSLEIGTRYELPPGEPPSWFSDVLERLLAEREGDIPIQVEASTGHRVDALLVERDPAIGPGAHGKVALHSHGEELVIGSEMIAAFTLLPDQTAEREPDSD
jgi:hypothetical protein